MTTTEHERMGRIVRFVTYNTQFCTGLDGRTDVDRIAGEIRDADVLCLQEIDRHWKRTGYVDQAREIVKHFPDYYWAYGPGLDVDTSLLDETGRVINRRRQFGNMVLARWPLLTVRNHLLPKLNLRTSLSLQRAALETVVDLPDGPCRIVSVHLAHAAQSEREIQIERLLSILHAAPNDGGAWSGTDYPECWGLDGPPQSQPRRTIAMGDYNMVPGSAEYTQICSPVGPSHGPLSTCDGLIDMWVAFGNGLTEGATFDQDEQPRRLDYAFTTNELAGRIQKIWVEQTATGSDHKPLWVELAL